MSRDKSRYRNFPKVDFTKANALDPNLITYKLFTKENFDAHIPLTEASIETVEFPKDVKTVVFIHGWTSSDSSPWYAPLKEAYFKGTNHNIIYLDWSMYAKMTYEESSANVKPVGEFIARFLKRCGIPAGNIHLVGHSLGSHLAAFVGKAYREQYGLKIGRITGLDPAGPSWSNHDMSKDELLSDQDAEFVDVVHTDIQIYGITHPCGHVDFYPNGGTNQPGCSESDPQEHCNHHRATKLFVESVNTKIVSTEIEVEEDEDFNVILRHRDCSKSARAVFGEHVNQSSRGTFHFTTNDTEPFLIE